MNRINHFGSPAEMVGPISTEYGELEEGASESWIKYHYWTYGRHFPSKAETKRALLEGRCRSEALDKAAELRDRLEAAIQGHDFSAMSARRQIKAADEGDEVSVERLIAGRDDFWDSISRSTVRNRVIRLGMVVSISVENDDTDFINLAATVGAACDILTGLGYGVQVVCADLGYCGESKKGGQRTIRRGELKGDKCSTYKITGDVRDPANWCGTVLTLKGSDEPPDLARILSAGLPGLSRWVFAHYRRKLADAARLLSMSYIPRELYPSLGVDYMISRSWVGATEAYILESVREITSGANVLLEV